MAPRSSIDLLPETVRHALERRLVESGFADYTELADWLQAEGYQISRSAVHRYGQKVERRFASIKASTEAARLIAEGAADEGDTRSEVVKLCPVGTVADKFQCHVFVVADIPGIHAATGCGQQGGVGGLAPA